MPLYSEMYHSYLGNTPTASSFNYVSSPYSPQTPTYSSTPSYAPVNYNRIPSAASRFLPKLTTISESPLNKHRLAALTRINSPKALINQHSASTYRPARPRNINTADIDVSSMRYVRRTAVEPPPALERSPNRFEAGKEEDPEKFFARSTIKRDRGMVRLNTMRKIPRVDQPEVVAPLSPKIVKESRERIYTEHEVKSPEIKTSWRNSFNEEFSLDRDKKVSPPMKSPGELLLERHFIRHEAKEQDQPFFTFDDIPVERRASVRRRSAAKIPSFKEICSDISSDKLTDDLNAGELRRKVSIVIEDEINKIRRSSSGALHSLAELKEMNIDEENDRDRRKSRKIKKVKSRTSIKLDRVAVVVDIDIDKPEPSLEASDVVEKPNIVETLENKTENLENKEINSLTNEDRPVEPKKLKPKVLKKSVEKLDENKKPVGIKKLADKPIEPLKIPEKLVKPLKLPEKPVESIKLPEKPVESLKLPVKPLEVKSPLETPVEPKKPTSEIDSKPKDCKIIKKKKKTDLAAILAAEESAQAPPITSLPQITKSAEANAKENALDAKVLSTNGENNKTNNGDLDSKLLLEKTPGAGVVGKKVIKKVVKVKQPELLHLVVENKQPVGQKATVSTNMIPLRREPSADDFWGQMGSRETVNFVARKKKLLELQKSLETSWQTEEEPEQIPDVPVIPEVKKKIIAKKPEVLDANGGLKNLKTSPDKKVETPDLKTEKVKDKVSAKSFIKEKSPISLIKDKKLDLPKAEEKSKPEVAQDKSNDTPDSPKSPKSPKLKITSSVEIEEPKSSILKTPLKVLEVKIEKIPEVKVTLKPKLVISILKKTKESEPEIKVPETPKKLEETKKLEIKKEPAKIEPVSALDVKNLIMPKKIAEISKVEPKVAQTSIEPEKLKTSEKLEVKVEPKKLETKPKILTLKKSELKVDEPKVPEKSIEPEKPKITEKLGVKVEPKKLETKPKILTPKKSELNEPDKPKITDKLEVKVEPKKLETKPKILTPKKPEIKETKIEETPKETAKTKIDLKSLTEEKSEESDKFILQPVPKIDKTKKLVILKKTAAETKPDATISKVLGKDSKTTLPTLPKVGLAANTPEPKQEITQPKPSLAVNTQKEDAKDVNNNIVAVDAVKGNLRARELEKPEKPLVEPTTGYNPKHAVLHKKDICFVQPKEGDKTTLLKQTEAPKGNESKNTKDAINTVNSSKIAQQDYDSGGTFGVLASLSSLTKFPTLCDLSDNVKITNNSQSKQSKANQSSIASDSLSSSDRTEDGETLLTYRELKEIENISGTEESESESSEESSSYDSEDSDWSDSMGKDKKFDPQKRVKLDFQKMKKCYVKEEKSAITLVARPRPLWKIKRNKNAQLVDSDESDTTGEISSGEEEDDEGTTPSDSASASNNSSTNSNRKKKSPSGSDASDIYEHITSLMPMMGYSSDNEEGDRNLKDEKNGDSSKTKNRLSTTSQDSGISGFYGATAPRSPRKMLGKRLVLFICAQNGNESLNNVYLHLKLRDKTF